MSTFGIILVVVAVLMVIYAVTAYNSFTVLKNRIENQGAQIEVQLKRRADLIPNLIETAKGYAKFEKGTLENITRLRGNVVNAANARESYAANNELGREFNRIMAVSENYPELKANSNFMKLQEELSETEEKIAKSRQFYNDVVTKYNTAIMLFPKSLFAGIFGFKKIELLEASAEEKKSVKIDSSDFNLE
ncbi:MAG: LemA family protein [Clostridium sp.]|nr:LemA family protein [Clostridium sp.]MCM1181073.1 LemA family protein [Clostridium sp.]